MSQTLKVRKGDTVQVMKGKDRGKQGRVIEADPKRGRRPRESHSLPAAWKD